MSESPKKKIDNPLFARTAREKGRVRDGKGRFIPTLKEPVQTVNELTDVKNRLIAENRITGVVEEVIEESPTFMVSTIGEDTEIDSVIDSVDILPNISEILGADVSDDIDVISDKSGSVLSVIDELEGELGDVVSENDMLRQELTIIRKEVSKLRATRESLQNQIEEARDEVVQMRELKERFSSAETDLRVAEDKFLGAQKEIEFLQSEKKNLEFELHGAKSTVRELERVNAEGSDEIRGLKEKVVLLEEIQANLEVAMQKKNRDLERIPAIEAELEAIITARDALDLDLTTSKKVLSRMREEMEVLETQYVITVEERDSFAKKLASCESENIDAAGRIQALAKEVGGLRTDRKTQDNQLVVLKKWVGDIHNKLVTTRSRTIKRAGVEDA